MPEAEQLPASTNRAPQPARADAEAPSRKPLVGGYAAQTRQLSPGAQPGYDTQASAQSPSDVLRDVAEAGGWMAYALMNADGMDSGAPPPGGGMYNTVFTVVGAKANVRNRKNMKKTTDEIVPKGTQVYQIATKGNNVQVVSAVGEPHVITAADNVWVGQKNIGGGGADVGLGNERTDTAAKDKAEEITAGLPPGRSPGTSPFKWNYGGGFRQTLDGTNLDSALMTKIIRMLQWAVENDMLAGDAVFGDGMRQPSTAHRNSVSWEVRKGTQQDTYVENIKALSGGKDKDNNQWYRPGWGKAEIQANANEIAPKESKSLAGYNYGDPKRAPHPMNSKPAVSRHCSGGAVDIDIPWRMKGKDARKGKADVWGYEEIYAMFGLHRTLPKGTKNQESWHVEENGKGLDGVDED